VADTVSFLISLAKQIARHRKSVSRLYRSKTMVSKFNTTDSYYRNRISRSHSTETNWYLATAPFAVLLYLLVRSRFRWRRNF